MTIKRVEIDFSVQSKEYTATQLNAQVCKNWYSIIDTDGQFKKPMFPFPGSQVWSDDSTANIYVRGMYSLNGVFYAVVGSEFRIYNDNGDFNVKGTLDSSVGIVEFMANDNQIFVTDFLGGYVYQLVGTVSRETGTFFKITGATSFIGTPTFTGSGLDDLTASGDYVGSNDKTYRVEIDGQSESSITSPEFFGSGLNDLSNGGTFTGVIDRNFRVEIDGVGATDTYKWSSDGGQTYDAQNVPIVAGAVPLKEGVTIQFQNTTGHTLNEYWTFDAVAAGTIDTFRWSDSDGNTWNAENVAITGADQLLNDGVIIVFAHLTGHTKTDYWKFSVTVDSVFYPPIIPIYLDSYGIFPKSNTQRFYLSSSEDFSEINALDYSSTNAFPDNLVCGISVNQEIIFIGTYTTEIWYDTGASPFPLQRRPNLLIGYGTKAPYSLAASSNNTVFWLAQSRNGGRIVVAMLNYSVEPISDKPLNDKLQEYEFIDDAEGFVCEWTGKIFYFLTIPSADVTWVFDVDAKKWDQRTTRRVAESANKQDYIEGRYLAKNHVYHNGEHYIGSWNSAKIYKMSNSYYKDGDMEIINEAVTSNFTINLDEVAIYSLQIKFEAATALVTGQGDDPTIMLQHSTDGGKSWGKEMWRTIGRVGQYKHRCKWNKLRFGRSHVFKIRCSDAVYKVLLGAVLEYEDTGT